MSETPRKQPELQQLGPDHIAIVGPSGATVDITGTAARRIGAMYEHMLTHGPEWAATYLAGITAGLAAKSTMDMEAMMENVRVKLAEGRKLIDEVRTRREDPE